jgi:hypothetical protein
VFTEYRKPFAKDCFNALQLACWNNDTASASWLFPKAFERGVSWTVIEVSPIITEFFGGRLQYREWVRSIYPPCRKKWESGIDTALRAIVIRMKREDDSEKLAISHNPTNSPGFYNAAKEYMALLERNAIELISLTRQNGFLGDNILGFSEGPIAPNLRDLNDSKKRASYSLNSLVDQLFYHHCCCFFSLRSELFKALKDGDISPSMYAVIYEWACKNKNMNILGIKSIGYPEGSSCKSSLTRCTKSYNICPTMSPILMNHNIPFVDSCRAEIGLASIAHFKKKHEYEKARGLKLFFGSFDTY